MKLLLSAAQEAPTGLASGRWAVAPWVIWAAGAGVVLVALLALAVRARRARSTQGKRS